MSKESETNIVSEKKPESYAVTRNAKGIRWVLLNNTPEQNEQLGIRNIHGLFLERYPEFNDLYPRGEDGKIAEDKIETAKTFVLERMGKIKDFSSILGRSAISRRVAPYFEGSHLVALEKSFKPWGINFPYQRNDNSVVVGKRVHRLFSETPIHMYTPELIENEARDILSKEGRFGQTVLKGLKKGRLSRAIGNVYPGGMRALKVKLKQEFTEVQLRSAWSYERIIKESQEFFDLEGELTTRTLHRRGRFDLSNAIVKYGGGYRRVKEALGLPESRQVGVPRDLWTIETIEANAAAVVKKYGYINYPLLSIIHQTSLGNAIGKYYPTKMVGLQEKLGLTKEGFNVQISPDQANEQLRSLLEGGK